MRLVIAWIAGVALVSVLLACGGTRVIAPKDMQALKSPLPTHSAVEAPKEVWNGGWFTLDEEFELPHPNPWKLKGGALVIRLDRCEWVTFGESRQAWAHVSVSLNGEYASLRVSEGESAEALGFRFECTHAHEKWDETSQDYFHNSRFKISR